MFGKCTAIGFVAAMAAPSLVFGQGFDLELDPGVGWVVRGGVGEGRSAYFTAEEAFSIEGAGFSADMAAGDYEVIIYEGRGEQAPAGPVLHSVVVPLGGIGLGWQDADIEFEFREGQDYILHFQHSVPGTAVASQYERGAVFWGNDPGEFRNLGVVTIRNGRAGRGSVSANNAAFPRMRLLGTTRTSECYPDCDGNGVLDFFDFLCFQNGFLAQDPYADCDENGVFDFFDFLCFQNEFLAGCP